MTVRDHMTIRLAAATYKYDAARETDAREQLGYGYVRFWQVVNALLSRADVEAEYPAEVRRLRRLADRRRGVRVKGSAAMR